MKIIIGLIRQAILGLKYTIEHVLECKRLAIYCT